MSADSLAVDRAMLLIKHLDNNAALLFSEWTLHWYVSANIEISDGCTLIGITEHRLNPQEAVLAFLDQLTAINHDQERVLVSRHGGQRRHHRWNGAAFVEVPLPTASTTEVSA